MNLTPNHCCEVNKGELMQPNNDAHVREDLIANTPKFKQVESKQDVDFQPAKDDIVEEPITANERYAKLLIGELITTIDKTSEEEKSCNESIYEHDAIPLSLHEECMTTARSN